MLTKKHVDELSFEIIGAAIEVQKSVGPRLIEDVYHRCMEHELALREVKFVTQMAVPVHFKGINLKTDLRCDLFVENTLCVELKSVKSLLPIYDAQLLTYMKLLKVPKGLLINFNSTNIFNSGQKTLVNRLYGRLPEQ